ncbi:MAG TPA: hypothetical protein DCO79_01800 [Spirochaeta sp.]|nr:hypothetical protein [Spirochaeta sp.]
MFRKTLLFITAVLLCLFISSSLYAEESESKSFLEILFKAIEETTDETIDIPALLDGSIDDPAAAVETVLEAPAAETTTAELQAVVVEPEIKRLAPAAESVVVREVLVFGTAGEGWILESFTDAGGAPTDRLKYTGREYIGGRTIFSFYPYSTGEFLIHLRKTDYSAGIIENRTIMLTVVEKKPDGNDAEIVESVEAPAEAPDPVQAEPQVVTASPEETVAELQDDDSQAVENLPVDYNTGREAVEAAAVLAQEGDCRAAADLLEKSLENALLPGLDEILFILAGYYEHCLDIRDERTAVKYYKVIIDLYPVSIYWAESRARMKYLERNYIYIR